MSERVINLEFSEPDMLSEIKRLITRATDTADYALATALINAALVIKNRDPEWVARMENALATARPPMPRDVGHKHEPGDIKACFTETVENARARSSATANQDHPRRGTGLPPHETCLKTTPMIGPIEWACGPDCPPSPLVGS